MPTTQADFNTLIRESIHNALESPSKRVGPRFRKAWLTNQEAMDYLGLSRSTLHRYRTSGLLPYSKIGQSVYYRRKDIHALLEEHLR